MRVREVTLSLREDFDDVLDEVEQVYGIEALAVTNIDPVQAYFDQNGVLAIIFDVETTEDE